MTASTAPSRAQATPTLGRLAPVMIVERVEPCIEFWVDRFGFDGENRVPGPDGSLVFASARKDDIEVMYQTMASVLAEAGDRAGEFAGHSVALFINVPDLNAVERAVAGAPVVKGRHKTFYGTEELYVREPGGNVVGFAQRLPEDNT
jgi:uncharacterized glyoxalase superfamily protein PhnB